MDGIENLPGEEWKDIPGYEGKYKISNYGRVYSFVTKHILKENTKNGSVVLLDKKQITLNKLVYNLFVHNTNKHVHCVDGNMHNHYYKNLYVPDVKSHIGEIINDKYVILDVERIKDKKTYVYTIQCNKCNSIIKITGSFDYLLRNKGFKCLCYYTYNIGDKILDNYIIIDRYIENGYCNYKLQCQVCGDVINRKSLKNSVKYFKCSCNKHIKYRVGDIYNGLIVLDIKYNKDTFHNMKYYVMCLNCGFIKWVQSHVFNNKHGIRCSCYQPPGYVDGRSNTRQYKAWRSMKYRCNGKLKLYENIFVCKFWDNDFLNFKSWYDVQLKNYSLDNYDIPEWVFIESKNHSNVKTLLSPAVDRIDPRFEYAPYNCQIIPGYINTSVKRWEDSNRSEKQLKIDELKFKRRKRNWIKEMIKKGYKKEDLI